MARKKSRRKPPPKRKPPVLPANFDCPFCNHDKSVDCKLDFKKNIGTLKCRICNADYETTIHRKY